MRSINVHNLFIIYYYTNNLLPTENGVSFEGELLRSINVLGNIIFTLLKLRPGI